VLQNMGRWDRTVRLVLAAVFAVLLIADLVKGTLAIVLAILAAIFVITTFVGFCPAYLPFGISTRGKGKKNDTCSR
jgi:O-antigen/teichoic acid export membrane protein